MSFVKEAAMAKWWAGEVAGEVSGRAIEWMGGAGFTRESGVEKFWRDSKIVSRRFGFALGEGYGADACFCRVRYMRGRRISSCRRSPSLFRRSIRRNYLIMSAHNGIICRALRDGAMVLQCYGAMVLIRKSRLSVYSIQAHAAPPPSIV